jgi:flagellar biosynthesis protein FlhA
LDPVWVQQILGKIKQAADRMTMKNEQPILLCSPSTRPHIKRLMERAMPSVPVLSTGEVAPQVRIVAMENIKSPNED